MGRPETFWSIELNGYVVSLRWTQDRRHLVAGTIEGDISIVDVGSGDVQVCRQAHAFGLSSLELSPDGTRIVTCGQDGAVRLWHAGDAALVAECPLPARWGTCASFSPSGRSIAVAAEKHLRIFSSTGDIVRDLNPYESTITDLAWGPTARGLNSEVLATTAYGGVTLWRRNVTKPRQFAWKGSSLVLAWSPDGRYIATGDQDSTVHFWIVAKGEDLEMTGYPMKVKELSWSATSRYLATGGSDVVTVWDCSGKGPAGTRPICLEGHEEKINAIAFAPVGVELVSGDNDGRVILWSLDRPSSNVSVELGSSVSSLTWSNDGAFFAAGTAEGIVYCVGWN
jgi:WD40 repeat protein